MNASGVSPVAGRHRPAKQNQSSPAFVNFHLDFGDLEPVNSKKWDAGTRHRPFRNRRPSDRKLITHRWRFRPARRQAPSELCKFYALAVSPDDRSGLGRPYVVAGLKIRGGSREDQRQADLAELFNIDAVGNAIALVVTHRRSLDRPAITPPLFSGF